MNENPEPSRDTRPRVVGPALRRTLLAGLAYGAFVAVVAAPLARVMDQALLLPPMFAPLVRGLLVVIGVVILMAAWRYPELGDDR